MHLNAALVEASGWFWSALEDPDAFEVDASGGRTKDGDLKPLGPFRGRSGTNCFAAEIEDGGRAGLELVSGSFTIAPPEKQDPDRKSEALMG